ncbi:MAG TPA: FlgD immunoglobulin-like domain containing protein [bacterium]|nr:FlgD immunoglobulin-like domain containing protein [bacterium]HQI48981.1 FlgD immunoglobulin-like domain containing protein [bacterium]HQJ63845.1 FlgD immunoglobulin-like domain containing protein [bacterium]
MRHFYSGNNGWPIALTMMVALLGIALPLYPTPYDITVDHTSISRFWSIPASKIQAITNNIRIYFGHTSHGAQITIGLQRLNQSLGAPYKVAIDWSLPTTTNTLCIRENTTWNPQDFFPTVPEALAANPEINVVMYMWCGQPETADWQGLLQYYTDQMEALEKQYRNVVFIYATGNAQQNDCSGDCRNQFNIALRNYCSAKGKPLFDFGDMDAWYNGEMATYVVPNWCPSAGQSIPIQHSQYYNPDGPGHTTYENCENKGMAFWYLLAQLIDIYTPVKLSAFHAAVQGKIVQLSWKTEMEWDNLGFSVERSEDGLTWSEIEFIHTVGSSTSGYEYHYSDRNVQSGRSYQYRLKQVSRDGQVEYFGPVKVTVRQPGTFGLMDTYPNPFNQSTYIGYELPMDTRVKLEVVNARGALVRHLEDQWQGKGVYEVIWDGRDDAGTALSSGVFFALLTTDQSRGMRKMVLIR